jgi:hypothetical protein
MHKSKSFVCTRCGGRGKITQPPTPVTTAFTPNVIPEGKCKKCGCQIPEIRLMSKPGVRFCIDCEPRGTKEVNSWVPRGVKIPTGYGA